MLVFGDLVGTICPPRFGTLQLRHQNGVKIGRTDFYEKCNELGDCRWNVSG
tara:strand:- start:728 stop:880 length:153 start_codon:yes stop_codon:yes gene_type:complete